jgi:hypothetical protein
MPFIERILFPVDFSPACVHGGLRHPLADICLGLLDVIQFGGMERFILRPSCRYAEI